MCEQTCETCEREHESIADSACAGCDVGGSFSQWQPKHAGQLKAKDAEIAELVKRIEDGIPDAAYSEHWKRKAETAEADYAAAEKRFGQRAVRLTEEIEKRVKAEARVKELEAERAAALDLLEALRQAQHDLDTSEGLTCCDSEPAPMDVPVTWKLSHPSRAAVDAALARAREAGIEVPE